MSFHNILPWSKELLAKLAEEALHRFDKLGSRDLVVVKVDVLQHSIHPFDLRSLFTLLNDHHFRVLLLPPVLLGSPTLFKALEQTILVPPELDADLLQLLAGDHPVLALPVLGVRQMFCAQSVVMPVSSILKISLTEVTVGMDKPSTSGAQRSSCACSWNR